MPIYEYKCKRCNKVFSVLQKVGANEKDTICPECGSADIKKLLSAFACSSAEGSPYSPSVPHSGFSG